MLGRGLRGKTLGIVGYGEIGQAVATRARAFGMEIVYAKRSRGEEPGQVELEELLERSHAVSLHCPLTAETRHLIDAAALGRMRDDAYLVNTARGPVVDEAALAAALRDGVIAGAALDVFEHEPDVHPGPARTSTTSCSCPISARRRSRRAPRWRSWRRRTSWRSWAVGGPRRPCTKRNPGVAHRP